MDPERESVSKLFVSLRADLWSFAETITERFSKYKYIKRVYCTGNKGRDAERRISDELLFVWFQHTGRTSWIGLLKRWNFFCYSCLNVDKRSLNLQKSGFSALIILWCFIKAVQQKVPVDKCKDFSNIHWKSISASNKHDPLQKRWVCSNTSNILHLKRHFNGRFLLNESVI